MKQLIGSLVLTLALAASASAQDSGSAPAASPEADSAIQDPAVQSPKGDRRDNAKSTLEERRVARLDLMFGRLAKTTNERRARRIARHIMRRLNQSGSDTVDFLMTRAGDRLKAKDYAKALDLLDGVVRLRPEFAEGWNRRATVHFIMGNYGQSIADIEQVLRREPRHWGALAGLSMILVSMERKAEALAVMNRALEVHPYLPRMKDRRDRLVLELDGADI